LQYVAGKYAQKNKINFVWGTNGEDSAEFWKNLKRLKRAKKSGLRKAILVPLKALEDSYINKGMKLSSVVINQSEHQKKETKRLLHKEGEILPSYFLVPEKKLQKEKIVLWLANLSPNKQADLYVKLINSCKMNDWKAVLGGGTSDRNYENEIRRLVDGSEISMEGKIKFEDSFGFYEQSSIYVNTSKPDADGLPNAYIQSWLHGTVVISLHHDPNGWMNTHNIGFSADGNFEALQHKLQELINHPELLKTMSANAIKFSKETFGSQSILEGYIKHFKKEE
jgi:glycosyltransferase involved in cell wall biosynthesis